TSSPVRLTPPLLPHLLSPLYPFSPLSPPPLFFFFYSPPPPRAPPSSPPRPSSDPRDRGRRAAAPGSPRLPPLPARSWRLQAGPRSEEHTSELQSLTNLVCRLLLEKKKKNKNQHRNRQTTTYEDRT